MSRFIKEFFDEWNAPATSRPGTVAFTDLAGSARFVYSNEVADLPFGNMEAVTEFVVGLHKNRLLQVWLEMNQLLTGSI